MTRGNGDGRHAEIERRYKSHRGERGRVGIGVVRIGELRRLFTALYGHVLPDDDAGRDDAFLMVCHLAKRPEADRRIPAWLSLWCPWMTEAEANAHGCPGDQ